MKKTASLISAVAIVYTLCGQSAAAAPANPPGDLATWACVGNCGSSAADGDISLSPLANDRYGWVSTSDGVSAVSPLNLSDNHLGSETNGSKILSGSFAASVGDRLEFHFNYVSTDGNGYDDYAWARLLNANDHSLVAWLFTARSTNSGSNKILPGDVVKNSEFDASAMITNYASYEFTAKTADWSPLGASNNSCWEDDAKGCGNTGWLQSSLSVAKGGNYRVEFGVTNWGDTAYDSGLAFDFRNLSDSHATAPVPEPETAMMMLAGLAFLATVIRRRRSAASLSAIP